MQSPPGQFIIYTKHARLVANLKITHRRRESLIEIMPNPITQIQNILNTQNLTQISRNSHCKSLVFLYLPNRINSLCDKFI